MARWTTADMPHQGGRSVVITGTGGLGLQDALAFARAGADVTIAGRNPAKGAAALQQIRAVVPDAQVQFEELTWHGWIRSQDLPSVCEIAVRGSIYSSITQQ